jgi:hypothetical protein
MGRDGSARRIALDYARLPGIRAERLTFCPGEPEIARFRGFRSPIQSHGAGAVCRSAVSRTVRSSVSTPYPSASRSIGFVPRTRPPRTHHQYRVAAIRIVPLRRSGGAFSRHSKHPLTHRNPARLVTHHRVQALSRCPPSSGRWFARAKRPRPERRLERRDVRRPTRDSRPRARSPRAFRARGARGRSPGGL